MFEKEISGYAFNISKRYTGDRIKLSSLLSDAELPDDFKRFAEAEVDELIDREGVGASKSGRLDMSGPEIQSLVREIRHILKNSYEFSREEFLELADKASKFVFNYVIRPHWTLEKFMFKGEQEIDRASINRASRFLSCYSYYPRGITEYLDFHGKSSLDIETWRKLHAKIDEHLLSTLPAKLSSLTASLFGLFEFASGNEKVPSDAMALFFRDKSAADIVDRIEFARDVKNIPSLDVMTLAMILEAASKDVSQNVAVLPSSEEPPKEFRTFERQKVSHPLRPEEAVPRAVPDVMRETPGGQAPPEHTTPTPSSAQGHPGPAAEGKRSAQSIRTFMSAKLEEKILKKIFRGSRSGYQIAVYRLDESSDWQSASKVVEGIFIDNDVDPFSKYAVAFTDVVSAKFRSTRGSGEKA